MILYPYSNLCTIRQGVGIIKGRRQGAVSYLTPRDTVSVVRNREREKKLKMKMKMTTKRRKRNKKKGYSLHRYRDGTVSIQV